ncbi:MAG: GTPase Era [Anaerolineae bacterium]|nr:GTPase Era [Anaerolineae bacterium]
MKTQRQNLNDDNADIDNASIVAAFLGQSTATNPKDHRSGYIAVVGKPNVGKSTLVNALIGHKVAIVSPKPQTTRRRILGILTHPDAQVLFVDTPGVHELRHSLNKVMMREVDQALADSDAILFVADVSHSPTDDDRNVAKRILAAKRPIVLALNKADTVDPRFLVQNVAAYEALVTKAPADPPPYMLTSAVRGDNLEKLLDMVLAVTPLGPPYYPPDQYTDQTERMIVSELIREQAIRNLSHEIPHAIAVLVDEFDERAGGAAYIAATLYVERDSQKGILIGGGGQMLKRIGAAARKNIEAELGRSVFLELWVKVREQWRTNSRTVNEFLAIENNK